MALHYSSEIDHENEQTWNKYILSGIAALVLVCGPIGAGVWCAATAYSHDTTMGKVLDVTINSLFGN